MIRYYLTTEFGDSCNTHLNDNYCGMKKNLGGSLWRDIVYLKNTTRLLPYYTKLKNSVTRNKLATIIIQAHKHMHIKIQVFIQRIMIGLKNEIFKLCKYRVSQKSLYILHLWFKVKAKTYRTKSLKIVTDEVELFKDSFNQIEVKLKKTTSVVGL